MFLAVGGWNTLFGYSVFALLYWLLSSEVSLVIIIIASYVLGVLNNFLTYKYLVFRTKGGHVREMGRFLVIYAPLLACNLVVLPLALKYLPLNAYVIQALYTLAVLVLTYVGHKYFTFRHRRENPPLSEDR
jgi:putative flippase GtrA